MTKHGNDQALIGTFIDAMITLAKIEGQVCAALEQLEIRTDTPYKQWFEQVE